MPNLILKKHELELEQNLIQWIEEKVGFEVFGPGLERIRSFFETWDQKSKKTKIITVAGTNGKGQTASEIAEYLRLAGKNVALWTSPHILSVRERIWPFPSRDELKTLLEKNWSKAENFKTTLSYYEWIFSAFCEWATQIQAEYWVLEVGLGGRLDATNLFDADCTALTSISRDHEAILGPGLKNILFEKLGVTRANVNLHSGLVSTYLREHCEQYCLNQGVPLISLASNEKSFCKLDYEQRNNLLAQSVAREFLGQNFSPKLETNSTKGRFEEMTTSGHRFIFIGAHNIAGTREVISTLTSGNRREMKPFSLGLLGLSVRPKDEIGGILRAWDEAPCVTKKMGFCSFEHPRAFHPQDWNGQGKWYFDRDFKYTLEQILKESLGQNILVAGSYYFIGEVQKFLMDSSS